MTKTEENLKKALAGESQARAKYVKWAGVANKEGHQAVAKIFLETAENEYEHAAMIMNQLKVAGTTEDNLKTAAAGEVHEWTSMYPQFLKEAREEKNDRAAKFLESILRIETHHGKRYQVLLERLQNGTLHKSDKEETWFCTVLLHYRAVTPRSPLQCYSFHSAPTVRPSLARIGSSSRHAGTRRG